MSLFISVIVFPYLFPVSQFIARIISLFTSRIFVSPILRVYPIRMGNPPTESLDTWYSMHCLPSLLTLGSDTSAASRAAVCSGERPQGWVLSPG